MLIGVLGGGQLGQMIALAGLPMGLRFRFLDPSAEACAAAAGELHVGSFTDSAAIDRFVQNLDAVTFEFENVPASAVHHAASCRPTHPSARSLEVGQDRGKEKALFASVGLDVPRYVLSRTTEHLDSAIESLGFPVVVKTVREGYDGKGQRVVRDEASKRSAIEAMGSVEVIVEDLVAFHREVSLIGVRSVTGEMAFYPLTENVHQSGMLRVSTPRADDPLQPEAERVGRAILESLGHVGVLAIEFFVERDANGKERLLGNELAPRVHNSGHWTQDASETSQFENHLRAILGWPLGRTSLTRTCVMVNMVGRVPGREDLLGVGGARAWPRIHVYGKSSRAGRKVGHVNVVGESLPAVESLVTSLRAVTLRAEAMA